MRGNGTSSNRKAFAVVPTRVAYGVALLLLATVAADPVHGAARAKVTLTERAMTDGPQLTLGTLARIDASDPTLAAALDVVMVGYAPSPGENRWLDRREVTEALALAGFAPWDIELAGAEQVHITRSSQLVPTQRLLRALKHALSRDLGMDPSQLAIGELELADAPRVGGGELHMEVEFLTEPRLDTSLQSRILVSVSGVPTAEVHARVTATTKRSQSRPGPGVVTQKERRAATKRLIRSGQYVTIEIQRNGLQITTSGRAKGSGALGDEIPVMNSGSGIVVRGVVASEGLVRVRWGHATDSFREGRQ